MTLQLHWFLPTSGDSRTLVGAAVAPVVVLVVGMEAGEFRASWYSSDSSSAACAAVARPRGRW